MQHSHEMFFFMKKGYYAYFASERARSPKTQTRGTSPEGSLPPEILN